jgi:hypothetical protein
MHPDRQEDVVDKQPVNLIKVAERGQQQASQAGNRDVVDARAGLIVQIANWRRVGVVSDRVQRRTRQIESQSVIGLVEENGGIPFQVMETTLASPQVAHWRQSAILPIFVSGKITEFQTDNKSIFLLNRTAYFRQRIIASNLRDRYISSTQCPANDRRRVFDSQCLAKPLSISLGHHSINSSKGQTVDPHFVAPWI